MKSLIAIAIALTASISNAQILNPDSAEVRLRNVEREILHLKQRNQTLEGRVRQIEELLYNNPMPLPPIVDGGLQVCVVVNSYYNKALVGKSVSRIEAEAIARNSCSGVGMPSYCQKAQCDIEDFSEHTCRMTNTYYNKDSLGRSKSILEAKAIARNGCAATGMPSYCTEATVLCD